jgi:membrane associated rhomboid family serine protease
LDPEPEVDQPLTLPVRFSQTQARTQTVSAAAAGFVAFHPDSLELRGRGTLNHFYRRFTVRHAFKDITAVSRQALTVTVFLCPEQDPKALVRLELEFRTVDAALAAEQRLPVAHSPELEQVQAEAHAFEQTLQAATPRLWVTPALVALNVVLFFAMATSNWTLEPTGKEAIQWGASFGPMTTGDEPWRAFTCMFFHFGFAHLGLNMWALLSAGLLVERLYGNLAFLVLYLGSGLCGALLSLLWNPNVVSAGASGAVFGVYGALILFIARHTDAIPRHLLDDLRNSTIGCVAYNLFYGFSQSGIDNAAHIGGLAAGLILGRVLALPVTPGRQVARRAATATALVAALMLCVWPLLPRPYDELSRTIDRIGAEDELAMEALRGLMDPKKNAGTTADEVSRQMEEKCEKTWVRISETLKTVPVDRVPFMQEDVDRLRRYTDLRLRWVRLLIRGIRGDPSADQAEFKKLSEELESIFTGSEDKNG